MICFFLSVVAFPQFPYHTKIHSNNAVYCIGIIQPRVGQYKMYFVSRIRIVILCWKITSCLLFHWSKIIQCVEYSTITTWGQLLLLCSSTPVAGATWCLFMINAICNLDCRKLKILFFKPFWTHQYNEKERKHSWNTKIYWKKYMQVSMLLKKKTNPSYKDRYFFPTVYFTEPLLSFRHGKLRSANFWWRVLMSASLV